MRWAACGTWAPGRRAQLLGASVLYFSERMYCTVVSGRAAAADPPPFERLEFPRPCSTRARETSMKIGTERWSELCWETDLQMAQEVGGGISFAGLHDQQRRSCTTHKLEQVNVLRGAGCQTVYGKAQSRGLMVRRALAIRPVFFPRPRRREFCGCE